MKIINPASEELIREVAEDSTSSIQNKFYLAEKAQKEWATKNISERIAHIQIFHDLLGERITELATTLTSEMGKPLNQSHGEIRGAMGRIAFFIKNSEKWLADETMYEESGMTEQIRYEALGVIANISAWNYPYLVGVNVFIPALIAGNAVLYKPSEFSTLTGLAIGEMMKAAGIPENIFQVIVGAKEAGEALLGLPLDGYFFTGSYRTGKYIYEKVASKMVPCQLELGGKDPMYVSADIADVKSAAQAGVEGAFYNNGQSCCAVERIYVHEKIYDEYISEFVEEAKQMKIGSPEAEGTFIGPLSRVEQLKFLQAQVEDAKNKGAKLLLGGNSVDGKGYYFEPTVLTDVNHDMHVMKEESFGPIIGIQKVQSDEEAIRLMQDTEYGLTASVYADHFETAEPIMQQINSGTVYWNCCDRVSARVPWSGRGHSGFGATLSYHGIRAFVQPKAYHLKSNN